MAVCGGRTGAWSSASVDAHALTGVSCASSTLCVAVDDEGGVLSSTDPTGGSDAWTLSPVDGSAVLVGVSCPSESLCVAIDASGNVLTSTTPTAPVWSTAAVDDAGNILTSTDPTGGAAAWTLGNVDPNPLNGVSCAAATLCVAVDSRGYRIAG